MTTCMYAKVHEEFFFLRYLQERHLLGSSRTQSMYFWQKDAHFQLLYISLFSSCILQAALVNNMRILFEPYIRNLSGPLHKFVDQAACSGPDPSLFLNNTK